MKLNLHFKSIHEKIKDIRCELCTYTCSTKNHLRHHRNSVHPSKVLLCDICDFKTGTRNLLNRHMTIHNPNQLVCNQCEFRTRSNEFLTNHIKAVHDKIRDYICGECGKKYSTSSNTQKETLGIATTFLQLIFYQPDYILA